MKFLTDLDAKLFLIETGFYSKVPEASKDMVVEDNILELFMQNRTELIGKLKDHRKSQNAKAQWRSKRPKMMKGIKAFHKSTEGKRFHRSLGNHLARKVTDESKKLNLFDMTEAVKGVCSAKTHLYIELEYFHQVHEQLELEELILDNAITYLNKIEKKLLSGGNLSEDEEEFLFDITETSALIASFAEKTGLSKGEVEKIWKSIKQNMIDNGKNPDEESFYPILVSALKKAINLTDK